MSTGCLNAGPDRARHADMKPLRLHEGKGRTRVSLSTHTIGEDLIVCLYNGAGHIGAVAVADYDRKSRRASTSVITRLGHKEDSLAAEAAHALCRILKQPVCAIAGIHLDNITGEEIEQIVLNCRKLLAQCGRRLSAGSFPLSSYPQD